jgi:Mrp family chromosome partitioning ATPase
VTTDGLETFLAILRRSWLVIVVLMALGVAQMNVIRRSQGPRYAAHARVILSPTDLATALSGIGQFVDPTVVDETEQALASSPQLFAYTARRNPGLGSASSIRSGMSVSKSGSTITFSGSGSSSSRVIANVNAVARAYPTWRASVAGSTIDQAISQVRQQLKAGGPNADLTSQLDRLQLLKTLSSGTVLHVEPTTSAAKTRPTPVSDSLLGAFIGLFVALIAVAIREALDSRVRSETEVEDLLAVPVLGTVEKLPRKVTTVVSGREAERFGDMYSLLAAGLVRRRGDDAGAGALTIAVTSATPGEGKTTTSINLAAALARRNARVVLIDFDTRRPAIGRVLRLPPQARGAEEAMRQPAALESLLWEVGMNGSGPNVSPASATPTRPMSEGRFEVLPIRPSKLQSLAGRRDRIRAVIEAAGERADFIVIDTSPALSTPDVTELVTVVDALLVVVRHGVVSRRTLQAMSRLQRTWPAQVDVEAVVVGAPTDVQTYAYYAPA